MVKKVLVHPIRLGQTSAYLLRGNRPILVDTGSPGSLQRLLDTLDQYRVNLRDIALIVLTHAHHDHFGNAAELKRLTGAPIAVHKADAAALESGKGADVVPVTTMARVATSLMGGRLRSEGVKADILLGDVFSLNEYGIAGRILHTPGHTPGSVSILLDTGEAIVGDTIMAMNPFKGPGMPMFIENPKALKGSIQRLQEQGPNRVFMTHGGAFDGDILHKIIF